MHLWSLGGGVNFQENGILWKVRRLTSGRLEFRYRKVQRVVLFSHLFLFGWNKRKLLVVCFRKIAFAADSIFLGEDWAKLLVLV